MKKLLLLFIQICVVFFVFSQNGSWILAPNYIQDMSGPQIPLPLPDNGLGIITSPFFGYEQVHAEGSSNMVNDPQGNILFSVVDGAIFDANGDLKDFTWHQDWIQNLDYNTDNGATQTEAFIEYYPNYSHSSETVIVRNPANCRQFYIFGAIVEKGWLETMPENFGPLLHARPYYALYDECVGEVVKRGEWFSDEPTYVPLIEVNDPIATPQTFLNPANTNGDPALTYTEYSDQTTFSGCPGFGATPMNADGSRFVCAYMMNALYVIKIESNGNLRYWKRYTGMTDFPIGGLSLKRSEFEVVYDANIDKFKIAAYYAFHGNPLIAEFPTLVYAEFSSDMLVKTTEQYIPVNNDVHGIEFSPDLTKIYFTTSGIPPGLYDPGIWYCDISAGFTTNYLFDASAVSDQDFQYSFIELAGDGNLYFASSQGLHVLTSPNNPSPANFSISPTVSLPIHDSYSGMPLQEHNLRSFNLPDQIDGEDYNSALTNNISCCVFYNEYDVDMFAATSGTCGGIWTPTCNPLNGGTGSVATVREEMRIPAGTDITIDGMTIKFAPGARLVIENGIGSIGGELTLTNGTLLTVDEQCGTDSKWLGVEVWGNTNISQILGYQGRLNMTGNSIIEHAQIGILVSKRKSHYFDENCQEDIVFENFTFDDTRNGGIVVADNSSIINCQRGVWFRNYMANFFSITPNNLSFFTKMQFSWDNNIHDMSVQDLARLDRIKGVRFHGCTFTNNMTSGSSGYLNGRGIYSTEAQFHVAGFCPGSFPVAQLTCPGLINTTFTNLEHGIRSINSDLLTFSCKESIFNNCRYGIYVKGTQYEEIYKNYFFIRESDQYQTAGIALYGSTGYHIEDNDFINQDDPAFVTGTELTYGIVVNNSGEQPNEIYRNRFRNLKVAAQTELINAIEITASNHPKGDSFFMQGLVWKCNDYSALIYDHDMTLMNGRMNFYQGIPNAGPSLLARKRGAANNQFSYIGEPFGQAHDIFLSDESQRIQYSYLSEVERIPDSYTDQNVVGGITMNNVVDLEETLWNGNSITNMTNTCPSKLSLIDPNFGHNKYKDLQTDIVVKLELIDGGCTVCRLNAIDNGTDQQKYDDLMTSSPFLSDAVLIAYINSNPSSTYLQDVMITNSHLSDNVLNVLQNFPMPNGTANAIANAQTIVSARTDLFRTINDLRHEGELLYNTLIRQELLSQNPDYNNLVEIIELKNDNKRFEDRLDYENALNNVPEIEAYRDSSQYTGSSPEYFELTMIQQEIGSFNSMNEAVAADSTIIISLTNLSYNANDPFTSIKADNLLEVYSSILPDPNFLVDSLSLNFQKSGTQYQKIDLHRAVEVNIYPNPSTGIVNFDYPGQHSGSMEITVVNLEGKIMAEIKAQETNGERLDLSNLNKGFYLVRIKLDGTEIPPVKLKML